MRPVSRLSVFALVPVALLGLLGCADSRVVPTPIAMFKTSRLKSWLLILGAGLFVILTACSSSSDYIQSSDPSGGSSISILNGRTDGIWDRDRDLTSPHIQIRCRTEWHLPSLSIDISGDVSDAITYLHWSGHGIYEVKVTVGDWTGVTERTGSVLARSGGVLMSRWDVTYDYRDPFTLDIFTNLVNSSADQFSVKAGKAVHTFYLTDEIRAAMRESIPPHCYDGMEMSN